MKLTNNNKGFTLIELIMVIVILGILAAVVVPKFFDFTAKAHDANKEAVYGAVRSGLMLYAADALVNGGSRKFPGADDMDASWSKILDEQPEGWSVGSAGSGTTTLKYTADGDSILYTSPIGGDSTKYTLSNSF